MRPSDKLRPIEIVRGYLSGSPGSVLYRSGDTVVLCTASIQEGVPPWMAGRGKGWVTAEYNMLPHSTSPRKNRERDGKTDGRTTEIQRLIGRSMRAVVDLAALGERSVTVDCDVLQADGGTRTAAITGGFIALADAIASVFPNCIPPGISPGLTSLGLTSLGLASPGLTSPGLTSPGLTSPGLTSPGLAEGFSPEPVSGDWGGPIKDSIAAVSVGVVDGINYLDLDYRLDSQADVDMNVVMTGRGRFVEIQGSGEEATFDHDQLQDLLRLASEGIRELTRRQRQSLAR